MHTALVAIANPIEAAQKLGGLFTMPHQMAVFVLINRLSRWNCLEGKGQIYEKKFR